MCMRLMGKFTCSKDPVWCFWRYLTDLQRLGEVGYLRGLLENRWPWETKPIKETHCEEEEKLILGVKQDPSLTSMSPEHTARQPREGLELWHVCTQPSRPTNSQSPGGIPASCSPAAKMSSWRRVALALWDGMLDWDGGKQVCVQLLTSWVTSDCLCIHLAIDLSLPKSTDWELRTSPLPRQVGGHEVEKQLRRGSHSVWGEGPRPPVCMCVRVYVKG